jgi:trigger factor
VNVTLEKQDQVNAMLTVEISPEDYQSGVEEKLRNYRKNAAIPGFRKGKVPMGVVKKMVGKSVFVDEVNRVTSDALYNYLQENKVPVLGQPLNNPEATPEPDFDQYGDFKFVFDLGLSPEFDLKITSKDKVTRYVIEVNDAEVEKEVEQVARRYGSLEVTGEVRDEKDSVKGLLTELDSDGNPLEGGVSEQEATILPEIVKDKKTKKVLMGAKTGDELDVDIFKLFNDNESVISQSTGIAAEGVKDLNNTFKFTITEIKKFIPSEINQELFDKVFGEGAVSNEEEFKAKLKENLEIYYKSEAENHLNHEIDHLISDKHELQLPDEFLKRWLMQTKSDTYNEDNIDEAYDREAKVLRDQLVKDKIMDEQNMEATQEELSQASLAYTTQMLRQYGITNPEMEMVKRMEEQNQQDRNYMQRIHDIVLDGKVKDHLKSVITIKEKKTSVEKFYDMIKKHNEKHGH